MLNIGTITALEKEAALNAYTLYSAEVAQLPRFSRAEQGELVDLARNGHDEARHLLILNCLHWALLMAHRIYQERRPLHVEVLDLAAEANLKMMEKIDKALAANDPVAYLMTIASQAIRVYCTYHAPLIQRPEWLSRQELAEFHTFLPPIESLDEPLHTDRIMFRLEQVAASPLRLDLDEQSEHGISERFTLLYQALERLSCSQRATTIRLYGLFDQPKETASEIASSSHLKYRSVVANARLARNHLRSLLADHLPQMLQPKLIPVDD